MGRGDIAAGKGVTPAQMLFSPDFLDEIRLRVGLADVVGRRTKLTKRGREFVGLCPFHKEKTPSFTVNEDKGFYHCFGCGAHGDVIRFTTEIEGLPFVDAVTKLAAQAGLQLPTVSAGDRERDARSKTLRDVVEAAAEWFESQLGSATGEEARNYLAGRGIRPEIAAKFRIGYAPERKSSLKDAMLARDYSEDLLKEAGLLGAPDDGRPSYDYFRNRLVFPIWDRRGQVIAFGGRTLGDARAKYLNSPETLLFHKGSVLYNLHHAAPIARDTDTLLVVEGYMDVVGLAAGGIGHAVAPLGTALTEAQLTMLWRVVPEPVLCFDGDKAGRGAAYRAAERAVPLLKPGYSLRFVMLPEGEDPDSLVRARGRGAMDDVLAQPLDLSDILWEMLTAGKTFDTPARQAGLEAEIGKLTRQIPDERVRAHYSRYMRRRLNDLVGVPNSRARVSGYSGRDWGGNKGQNQFRGGATSSLKNSLIGRVGANPEPRERSLVLTLLSHPGLLSQYGEEFAMIEFLTPELDKLRNEIIRIAVENPALDREVLKRQLNEEGCGELLERAIGGGSAPPEWFTSPDAATQDAETGLNILLKRQYQAMLHKQLDEAKIAYIADESPKNWEKFTALQQTVQAAEGDEADIVGFGQASGLEII